jgi:hypothetical protein
MNCNHLAFQLARERQERLIEELSRERLLTRERLVERRPSIRLSIGRRLIAAGERIAADPELGLARSR